MGLKGVQWGLRKCSGALGSAVGLKGVQLCLKGVKILNLKKYAVSDKLLYFNSHIR